MYDHLGLKVSNLDASVRFYTAALASRFLTFNPMWSYMMISKWRAPEMREQKVTLVSAG